MPKRNLPIQDTDIRVTKQQLAHSNFIANDIIVSDSLGKLPLLNGPRRMTFIFVALCTNGHARIVVDTEERQIKKGDLVIISERHVINEFQGSDDAEGLVMIMSTKFFYDVVHDIKDLSSIFIVSKNHPILNLTDEESAIFVEYHSLLRRKIADTKNTYRRNIVGCVVHAMFYELSNVVITKQQHTANNNIRSNAVFSRFIALVEKNHIHERRVGWYADQLGITHKHLSETVKGVSMRTPNEWIDSYVTQEARLLLKNSGCSIKEIADKLHFPNQSFFGKYFKDHVGMSPSQYRNN